MKKNFIPTKLFFAATMMAAGMFGLVSCDDDDDVQEPTIDPIEPTVVYGDYAGLMTMTLAEAGDSADAAVADVKATVKDDSVCFSDFPVKDIVVSILGDEEAAEMIVEKLDPIHYAINYDATVAAAQDSVSLTFHAEPLQLVFNLPAEEGKEPQQFKVEVEIAATKKGTYSVADGRMKFAITAQNVLLSMGEMKVPLPTFAPTTFSFDLKKQ